MKSFFSNNRIVVMQTFVFVLVLLLNSQQLYARTIFSAIAKHDDSVVVERYDYDAIKHFEVLNAGEVPYYKHLKESALAINAAIVDYRDKFARATTKFSGASGTYDVSLITLAEFDGECTYRFLVNGKVAGVFKNPPVPVEEDYKRQIVVFKGITINKNDVIAVESNSHTNLLIPEGEGTAWARGRWQRVFMTKSM